MSERKIDYGVLDDLLGYAIRKAQLVIYDDFLETLAAWDITPARFSALVIIANNEELKLTELAQSLNVARSGAVTMVDALVAKEYVARHAVPGDARACSLVLTAKGRRALEAMSRHVMAHDRRMTSRLSEEERTNLLALTKRIGRAEKKGPARARAPSDRAR